MNRFDYPTAPLILGFVLGDPLERALRQALMLSDGDPTIFVSRPISVAMLAASAVILLVPLFGALLRRGQRPGLDA